MCVVNKLWNIWFTSFRIERFLHSFQIERHLLLASACMRDICLYLDQHASQICTLDTSDSSLTIPLCTFREKDVSSAYEQLLDPSKSLVNKSNNSPPILAFQHLSTLYSLSIWTYRAACCAIISIKGSVWVWSEDMMDVWG